MGGHLTWIKPRFSFYVFQGLLEFVFHPLYDPRLVYRQNIEDVHVLSFKELPDSRKIEVVASIGNANQETE